MILRRRPLEPALDTSPRQGRVPDSTESAAPASEPSALDRHVDLSRISGETLAWTAVLLVAVLLRLMGLTQWPLSAREARIASNALSLVQGGALSPDVAMQPLPVGLVAFGTFLFGASDFIVRLVPAGLGIGSILLLFPLRSRLGRGPALGVAIAMALSPTLVFSSRTLDAGSLLVMGSLMLVVVLGWSEAQPGYGSMFVLGAVGALLPLSGPLGWIALPLVLVTAPAIFGRWLPSPRAISGIALGFLATIIMVSTSLFTRPAGFAGFVNASLSEFWSNHLAAPGSGWFLIPIEVVLYELLPLVLGVYTVYVMLWNPGRLNVGTERLARAIVAWTLLAGTVTLLLGGKGPEVYSLLVLPLLLLGGSGLCAAAGTVEWRILFRGSGTWFPVALLLTVVAAASTLGLLFGNSGGDSFRWSMTLLVIGALILIPLALLTLSLARRLDGRAGPIVALMLAVLLALFGLRSSLLLSATDLGRPGTLLLAGSTAPEVEFVVDRIQRLSLDLTATKADVHDPTGGHGLTIGVERSIAEPFVWYLRAFPKVTVIAPHVEGTVPESFQVIITRSDDGAELVPKDAGYVERSYDLTVPLAHSFDPPPSWTSMAEGLINPRILKRYVDFLFDRELVSSPAGPQFNLAMDAELAAKIYGEDVPSPRP